MKSQVILKRLNPEEAAKAFVADFIEKNDVPEILRGGLEDEVLEAARDITDGFDAEDVALVSQEAFNTILGAYAEAWYGDQLDQRMADQAYYGQYAVNSIHVHKGGVVNMYF